jgi:sulfur carrier protein ThiS
MGISKHATEFAGYKVEPYVPAVGLTTKQPGSSLRDALISAVREGLDDKASRMALADFLSEQGETPHPVAYRVNGDGMPEQLKAFLADPLLVLVQALVVGFCFDLSGEGSELAVQLLVNARERLPNLKALFFGDLTYSDREISWINLSDLTGLLAAFPPLEHFRSRGGNNLVVKELEHRNLKSLTFEASNLPREVVVAVGGSTLPALEHLELWLGTDEYGANTRPEDLAGILEGGLAPSLRYLGLRNSDISDDVAVAVAGSPLLKKVRVLDLSLGTLGDRGAQALLAAPALAKLEKLDIHHHYVSPDVVARLLALGIQVDASGAEEVEDPDEPEAGRYVAHAE